MKSYTDKNQKKSNRVADSFSNPQQSNGTAFQFVDNRTAAVAQCQLAEAINTSPRQVAQRQQLKTLFGNTAQLQSMDADELQMKTNSAVLQRTGPEEEELLQGKFETLQRQEGLEEEELLQGKFDAPPVQRERDSKPNHTGLPNNLKAGIENLSGYSMDDVSVHYNSPRPAQIQAHAYAQGTDIHLASGQEKHLAHEAWHVVQQRQGRVKPTVQMKDGVEVNDDKGLETEADVMGAQAISVGVKQAMQESGDSIESDPIGVAHPNSDKPAQFNAHAYAQGTDIHLASGQEKHLPHEAWHVVQQKQGRVKPTLQMKDKVNINDDAGLEKEADVMGAKALQIHRIEKSAFEFPLHDSTHQRQGRKYIGVTPRPHGGVTPSLQLMLGYGDQGKRPNTSMPLSSELTEIDKRDEDALPRGESEFHISTVIVRKQMPVGREPDLDMMHWGLLFEVQNEKDIEWMQVDLTLNHGYRIIKGAGIEARRSSLDEVYISKKPLTKSIVKAAVEKLAAAGLEYYNPSKKSVAYEQKFEEFRYSCQTFVTNMIEELGLESAGQSVIEKRV